MEVIDVVAFETWIEGGLRYTNDTTFPKLQPLADIVPPCIKSLFLRQGSKKTITHALGLLKFKKERAPNLELLHITLDEDEQTTDMEVLVLAVDVEILKNEGAKCGVMVVVENGSMDTDDIDEFNLVRIYYHASNIQKKQCRYT